MNNEKLIEEAARRYPDNAHTGTTPLYAQMKREAFIEGAVFEKAHTPTDDERAEVSTAIDYLDELIEVFSHRVDVQRVLRWVIGRLRLPAPLKATTHSDPDPLWDRLYGDGTSMMPPAKAPEPQGEPSGIPFYDQKMRELDAVRAQGDPSDAQVLAALNAYNDDLDAELRDWSPCARTACCWGVLTSA